ncbi:hypothetical protein Tco_0884925 [Tanacetum coccineum]
MVACLEKTKGNSDFHEIVDFLASSLIHHALTLSPTIYTSYIEQFRKTASSQTINDVKQINATIDSKVVVVTEASIRSSLLFNDVDGTACLTNEAIFQNLALMGYKAGFLPWSLHTHTTTKLQRSVHLKSRIKKMEKKCKPSISHHRAWLKSVHKLSMKNRFGKKESISKQGRKKSKPESTLDDSIVFDDQDHGIEYMETEEAVDEGRQSGENEEVKLTDDTEKIDKVQAKMDASEELVARLQMEEREREMYTIEERSKQLVEFFKRRKKLLAEERVAAVRNKPPTRTQPRALYIKEQERDADFVPIRSERDEKMIDKMNKKAAGMDEEEVPESTKVKVKRKVMKRTSGKKCQGRETEDRKLKEIVPDEEEEIDYEVLGMRYPIVNWESAFYHTDRYGVPHDYYRVFRANGSSRYIKTFTEMVLRFDRLDFIELHSLVMQRFSTTTPEGIDLVLWGDLRIMFEETADDDI